MFAGDVKCFLLSRRENMAWILIVLISMWMYLVKMSPRLYEAEENGDITIGWDFQTKADMTRSNMVCFLQSEPLELFYQMIKGVEAPESQHQRFAGRVHCDRDALRDGRVRLQVSAVTAEDSGNYRCDLAAAYDKTTRRWELEASEEFVLSVNQKNVNTPGRTTTPGAKQPAGAPEQGRDRCKTSSRVGPYLAAVALIVLVAYAVYLVAEATPCLAALVG
ncbi:uncharacterized protein LOC111239720 isoform X3 [Seriola dumerili]|uniref:uncharacterized protein LOC111239720 isoform X3 n=1 Tax=Seriola dumerili TaxID=41447 RepID=UPI000BBE10C8|nr:uncharacterized protein LOC111239720 isoform X3 [Seriola dumerili]